MIRRTGMRVVDFACRYRRQCFGARLGPCLDRHESKPNQGRQPRRERYRKGGARSLHPVDSAVR